MDNTIDTLQIKIDEARSKLSTETRLAIDDVNWKLTILEMKKYSSEQLENLETETELLLSGILSPGAYKEELKTRMKLTETDVISLLNEMDKLIFKKIQEKLIENLSGKTKNASQTQAVNTSQQKTSDGIPLPPYKKANPIQTSIPPVNLPTANNVNTQKVEVKPNIPEVRKNPSFVVSTIENMSQNNTQVKKVEPQIPEVKSEIKIEIPKIVEQKHETVIPPIQAEVKPITPVTPSVSSIMEEKMKGPTVSNSTVSDYSTIEKLPPVNNSIPSQGTPSHDPYREAVE